MVGNPSGRTVPQRNEGEVLDVPSAGLSFSFVTAVVSSFVTFDSVEAAPDIVTKLTSVCSGGEIFVLFGEGYNVVELQKVIRSIKSRN